MFHGKFFAEHLWATTTKYHFAGWVDLTQNVTIDLGFCWFPVNNFRDDNMNHMHVAISGVPEQLVVTELIYCW